MCFEFYEPETIKFSLVSTVKKFLRLVYDFIDQLLSSRHEELEPLKIGNKKIHSFWQRMMQDWFNSLLR